MLSTGLHLASDSTVHRIRGRRFFRASRLGGGELVVQRAGQTGDDLVLHVEEIGERLVETLGPEMIARFGVDELHVDAHAIAAALNAAFDDIADVQFTSDLSSGRAACLCRQTPYFARLRRHLVCAKDRS